MSSFPPTDWQVRHLKDFDLYEAVTPAKTKLFMEALLVAKPASGQEGAFRFAISGDQKVLIELKVTNVWNDDIFKGMTVMAELGNGSVFQLQKNSLTSRWADVEELVRAQDADGFDEEGEDVSEQFLEGWQSIQRNHKQGANLGLVWRWAISVSDEGKGMEVLVQAFPASLSYISNHSELRQVNYYHIF